MAQQDFSMFDKVGTFAEGVAKRVAKPTTPLAQNLLIDPPEKESTDPRKRDFPTFFPVGVPGVGGVMIEDDQVKPLTDKPYLTTEPALGSDVEIKYGEPFIGFKPIESRMRKVVQREKLTPILAVRGVKQDGSFFTPYDAPNYADVGESQIMNADFMVNKAGQREKLLSSDTFEDRITAINNFKATQLTYEDSICKRR